MRILLIEDEPELAQMLGAELARNDLVVDHVTSIADAREALARMLADSGPPPAPPFDGLGILTVAREHRNRHGSILLALDSTLAAFEDARTRQAG